MSLDPIPPIAPARVKALLLPLGQIKAERFASFVDRLQGENVVHLRDISADGRPNRNMFSPLAYPDGVMFYDLITHVPPPSHLTLAPFDLYREPLAVIALADGKELGEVSFSKRQSSNGTAPTMVEKNIRALHQELEDLRDHYPRALVHQVLIYDYVAPTNAIPMPEGVVAIPPAEDWTRTTMKTVMCDVSSLLLAEMTTLARSFEAMSTIESPVHHQQRPGSGPWTPNPGKPNGVPRRNSQHGPNGRSSSTGAMDKSQARMSMPPVLPRPQISSSSSTPALRPTSPPARSGLSQPPISSDDVPASPDSAASTPRPESHAETPDGLRDMSHSRISVQGFGPGSSNDKWRLKAKGRSCVVIGSMYLQAGRWSDSLRELAEGANAARSLNDHIWHGKALELILVNLFLLGWSGLDFQIPMVCFPTQEGTGKPTKPKVDAASAKEGQPKHMYNLQVILPDLLDRISNLYSRKRVESEKLPALAYAETTIRFCKILSALHFNGGEMNKSFLDMVVTGGLPEKSLTTSPRLNITPSRQQIVSSLMEAFPSSAFASELLTTVDRASILSGIAAVLGPLGFHRKKALVIRELVSVLINGLVEARTRGAADAGVHPAAGLVSLVGNAQTGGTVALDLKDADIEQGIEGFLELLCRSYGVVGYDTSRDRSAEAQNRDSSDEAVIARIQRQSSTRFFGFQEIKLNILRACINFSEALPDFNGVLKFASDLLRTAGSGVAPGPRKEDSTPMMYSEEQSRLVTVIARVADLATQLGYSDVGAEYWDEFLVRGVKMDPLPSTRLPIPHAQSALPGAAAGRTSQDVNPFIYNPFLKKPDNTAVEHFLVADELATFRITLQNTFDVELEIESIRLDTEGVEFEAISETARLGPNRTQVVKLRGKPKEKGAVKITGAVIKIRGCRERRFPVFTSSWQPSRDIKLKATGMTALEGESDLMRSTCVPLQPESLALSVIQPQPLLVVKSSTLPQSSVMLLEGERQSFSITLENKSSTPVDFMLFSFKDSTQGPLQTALNNREASPAELHEYELILMRRQALRLPTNTQQRNIAAGGEATFEFEILGKPGLTDATIQVDYTHLGIPRDEVTEQFFTRQVSLDLTVTVNASVEISRIDALPIQGKIPAALWDRFGSSHSVDVDDYCLVSMDIRNAWPSSMAVHIEGDDGMAVEESVLPGNTNRIIMPVKRVYLEDPHASIPSLNPARERQFVVSTSKISPEVERAGREAFWYREKVLEGVKATWSTMTAPKRKGVIELRSLRLTPRMIEAIKVDEVGIDILVGEARSMNSVEVNKAFVDEPTQVTVQITNRTNTPISPVIRLMPTLCHRSPNTALDYTRRIAWNGTLQQHLPLLLGKDSAEFVMRMTALCRGEFELTATVEEVQVWEDKTRDLTLVTKERSSTQSMAQAALGVRERRMWHSRRPCILTVKDRDD